MRNVDWSIIEDDTTEVLLSRTGQAEQGRASQAMAQGPHTAQQVGEATGRLADLGYAACLAMTPTLFRSPNFGR